MRGVYAWLGWFFCELTFTVRYPDSWFDEEGEPRNKFYAFLSEIHYQVYRLGCKLYEKAYF